MSASPPPLPIWDFLRMATRFGIVGLSSIAVYFVLLFLLRPLVDPIWLLTGLAYGGSMVFNYVAQSQFTFNARAQDLRAVHRYVWMQGGCMVFNSVAMTLLVDWLGLNLWGAQLGVTACIAASSFLLSKYWVYAQDN